MKIEDILTLVNAGFSKDDIGRLLNAVEDPVKNVEHPVKNVENPVKNVENTVNNVENTKIDKAGKETNNTNEMILTAINNLTSTIQASNIMNSSQPENKENANDVIAKMIGGKVNGK